MLALCKRLATIAVPRAAFFRALGVGGPLILAFTLSKLMKLGIEDRHGALVEDLLQTCFDYVIGTLRDSALTFLLLVPAAIALAAALLSQRSPKRAWWIVGAPLVYLAVVVVLGLRAEPDPWHPQFLMRAVHELRVCGDLWWHEALIAEIVVGALSFYFASGRTPASPTRLAMWAVITAAYGVVGLDLAFLCVTHSALTPEDLSYAIESPAGTLTLIQEFVPPHLGMLLIALLVVLAIVRLVPFQRLRLEGAPVRLGAVFWPALGVVLAARTFASTPTVDPLADNPLIMMPVEALSIPFNRSELLTEPPHASSQVPQLQRGPVTLVETSQTRRLNVVIVMLESTRADATTVYTPGLATTPFLATLARESLVVDEMYAVTPRSSAARYTTLAGQYAATADIEPDIGGTTPGVGPQTSLPRLLRTRGYTSAYFTPATLKFENDGKVVRALDFDHVVAREDLPKPADGYSMVFGYEDRHALPTIEHWLDARAADARPFLLTVVTNVGHYPYSLPPSFTQQTYPSRNGWHERYLNCMRYQDDYVRDLVGALRERNMLENTVLIVLGDHGEEFYEHGTFMRGQTLFEESLHIPMLIRLPRAAERTGHIAGLRQQIDVLPTVIDALGLELADDVLPGRSILSSPGHSTVFFTGHVPMSLLAMRSGNRKYIYSFVRGETSVFDLDRDPGEQKDLRAEVPAAELSQAETDLRAWQVRVRHTF